MHREHLNLDDLLAAKPVPVIVEVAEPGFRPIGLDVRTKITDTFLTATMSPAALPDLNRNPRFAAVEVSRPLVTIE